MITLPNRSLSQDESFFTNSAYGWKGCFFTARNQSQAGCWACVNWSETTLSFLGFPQFWEIPNPPLFGCGCFFLWSQHQQPVSWRTIFFWGGGGWRSCWSTNMFLIFICSPLQKPCLFSGRSQPVMFGFSRGVYKCEFLNPVKPWKNHTNLKITCLHFGFPAKPVKLVDGLCETKTQGFGHRCWLQRKWHI